MSTKYKRDDHFSVLMETASCDYCGLTHEHVHAKEVPSTRFEERVTNYIRTGRASKVSPPYPWWPTPLWKDPKKGTVVIRLCSESVKPYGKFMPADVWTLNDCFFPDSTRHFQLHSFYEMHRAHGQEFFEKLSKLDIPLVLFPREEEEWVKAYGRSQHWAQVQKIEEIDKESFVEGLPLPPGGIITYPVDDAVTLAGREYFDNSINWLIAMAILGGYERIVITRIS